MNTGRYSGRFDSAPISRDIGRPQACYLASMPNQYVGQNAAGQLMDSAVAVEFTALAGKSLACHEHAKAGDPLIGGRAQI